MRITVRKASSERYRLTSPRGRDVVVDGKVAVYVRWSETGWYWYGVDSRINHNTLWGSPPKVFQTPEEGAEHAKEYIKSQLRPK